MPMPLSLCTLLKLPPSDQTLSTRQLQAVPFTPAHQNAEVTCWIQTLVTSQFVPLKLIPPLLLAPSRLELLQSIKTSRSVLPVVVTMLLTPCEFPFGTTR